MGSSMVLMFRWKRVALLVGSVVIVMLSMTWAAQTFGLPPLVNETLYSWHRHQVEQAGGICCAQIGANGKVQRFLYGADKCNIAE